MLRQSFNHLAKRFSYGLAVAIFSVLGGQVSAMLGYAFIILITDIPSVRLSLYTSILIGSATLASLIHYILLGLLHRWSQRGELPSLRHLNTWVKGENISDAIPTHDLVQLTETLEKLPRLNRRIAAVSSSSIVLVAIILEWILGGWTNAMRIALGGGIAIELYIIFITVVTELVTRGTLRQARQILSRRQAWHEPAYQAALTSKLVLFVILIADNLVLIISLFMLRPGILETPWIVALFAGITLSLISFMSYLIFHAVIRPLHELEQAATHLVHAQTVEFFSGSTNKEFIILAQRFYNAAQQIVEYRQRLQDLNQTLESRVAQRTAQLEAQKDALRTSEQKLSLHVQQTPLAVIEWNLDFEVMEWNPGAERIFGYSRDEAIGRHACDLIIPASSHQQVMEVWRALVNNQGERGGTNENRTQAGNIITCEWYNTPLVDQNGDVIGVASLALDITERIEADAALHKAKQTAEIARQVAEQARQTAENANRAKSAFLANMSHELRTPLNAIIGFSELLTQNHHLTLEQREHLNIIGHSGEHLLALINDVLEFSKIEAGRIELQEKDFDLHHLLASLEEIFLLRASTKALTLTFDIAPEVPPYIRSDENKLRQVLINLLSNAIKFTEYGEIALSVTSPPQATPAPELVMLAFEVADTGAGIRPDELAALFDAFVQTESGQKSQEGTGLGLPISQKFVHMLGGHINVSSEPGQGSRFSFEICAKSVPHPPASIARARQRVAGLAPGQKPRRLLVAEDKDSNRRLLVKVLAHLGASTQGFEIREAVNGQQAIEIWEAWHPDLIWMDMGMPVLDGHAATRHIKATAQGQRTVIIALTASAFEEERAEILAEGCDDFVRKPFLQADIVEMLKKHLGLCFLYTEAAAPSPDKLDHQSVLACKASSELPRELRESLHRAVLSADTEATLQLIQDIHTHDTPLANALTHLTHSFKFDTILTWIQGESQTQ